MMKCSASPSSATTYICSNHSHHSDWHAHPLCETISVDFICWVHFLQRQPLLRHVLSWNIPDYMSRSCVASSDGSGNDVILVPQGPSLPAQHVIEVCKKVFREQMSTFANSVRRTCAAVCPLYGDVPMGAPGPPGPKGPPGPPVSGFWVALGVTRAWGTHSPSPVCFLFFLPE